jgi:hypothetical protein
MDMRANAMYGTTKSAFTKYVDLRLRFPLKDILKLTIVFTTKWPTTQLRDATPVLHASLRLKQ